MARRRQPIYTRVVPDRVIVDLRSQVARLTARISTQIQQHVSSYEGPLDGERRRCIEGAVAAGLGEFHGLLIGRGRTDPAAGELFREIGEIEGLAGNGPEVLSAALRVVIAEVWREVNRVGVAHSLTAAAISQSVDLLFDEANRIWEQFEDGHRSGVRRRIDDGIAARDTIGAVLLDRESPARLARLIELAIEQRAKPMVVAVVRLRLDSAHAEPDDFGSDLIVVSDEREVVALSDAHHRDLLIKSLRQVWVDEPVAVSTVCLPHQVIDATRHARLLITIAEEQVIKGDEILDAADHEVTLWLQGDPLLRERLAGRLLAPFAAETPYRRDNLASTLLLRLEQNATAPKIAEELGIHPQTARHRARRLKQMFGDDHLDAETTFATMLALKATLPWWIADPRGRRKLKQR